MNAATAMAALAASVCLEKENTMGVKGTGNCEQRRRVRDAGHEAIERRDEEHGAGRHRAAEARHERGPPGQEAGKASVRLAEVDILSARLRTERGEFRVGHRTHEREHAAGQPCQQKPGRVGHCGGDCRRSEEDSAANDVGNDDGRCIERTEPPLEGLR